MITDQFPTSDDHGNPTFLGWGGLSHSRHQRTIFCEKSSDQTCRFGMSLLCGSSDLERQSGTVSVSEMVDFGGFLLYRTYVTYGCVWKLYIPQIAMAAMAIQSGKWFSKPPLEARFQTNPCLPMMSVEWEDMRMKDFLRHCEPNLKTTEFHLQLGHHICCHYKAWKVGQSFISSVSR